MPKNRTELAATWPPTFILRPAFNRHGARLHGKFVVTRDALLLYRECLLRRSNTVALPNGELRKLGISRQTKYRALDELREAAVITIGDRNGRSVGVTLLWFP